MEAQFEKVGTVDGLDVTVGYNIHGKHMPATRLDPEEYPEVEVIYYRIGEVDVEHLLTKEAKQQIDESIDFYDN